MNKPNLFILLGGFVLFFTGVTAQDKLFTIDEAIMGQYREFYPKNMYNLQWRGSTQKITFQDAMNFYELVTSQTDSNVICNTHQLNIALKEQNIDTIQRLPLISWLNDDEFNFQIPGYWINYSLTSKSITSKIVIPLEGSNFQIDNQAKTMAYTIDNNLFITDTDGKTFQITNDNDKNIVNGDVVSRNEFGIEKGIFWSPKSTKLAFYRKDNSKVKDYPLVDITAREAEVEYIKYPMAGMASENVSLGIYNLSTGKIVYIDRNDTISEKYLTNITWSPDEQNIYIAVLNRAQNHMQLNRYRAIDGSFDKILFEEKNEKYVEPLFPLIFDPSNQTQFIWQSRRDGFNHLYLYSTEGQLIKQLTSGNWEVIKVLGIDKKNNVFYQSTEPIPTQRQIGKVNLKNAKRLQLTTSPGTHEAIVNLENGLIIDQFNSITVPNNTSILSSDGKLKQQLLLASNPYKNFKMPEMQIGTIKAADGITELYYRLIKPIDFDSTKKYPVIVYVYGGPHLQLITDEWLGGAALWEFYMAQKGYVMFSVDNRGSANRGMNFENVIHRQCGVNEMKDQMAGIEFLKKLGYADMGKVGIHGWSYGGFMTTSLMVNYPKIFKVGVAGGPVIDWKYYEVMYGERYMDTPAENPEGYMVTSPANKVKQLEGKLLIIHGAIDPTVVWQNSLIFINECIKNKVPVDYFVYPLSEHNVRGIDRVHLMQKVTNYFDDNLK